MKRTALLLSLVLVASCSRELEMPAGADMVRVPLSLSVSSMELGFGEAPGGNTRAGDDRIQDTGDGTGTAIKNVFVLQFDGTSDAAKLVSWSYVGNYSATSDIELKATDTKNRIVFLANTFSPATRFPDGMTVAELKKFKIKNITNDKGVFGVEEVSDGVSNFYPMFSGDLIVENIATGTTLTCTLRRNIARINVTVVNQAAGGTDDIQIQSLRLRAVPNGCYNYTNYASSDATPDFSAFPETNYPADGSFKTLDYESVNWTAGTGDDDNKKTFTFYAPFNLRGTITNTDEKQKNKLAPSTATRCEVTATYLSGGERYPVTYTFVLGADMTSDCNLLPNRTYSYTFTIKQKGNPDIDPRVEDWGPVDYTLSTAPRANCYILNPPTSSDMSRKFLIPIDRVRVFWGSGDYEKADQTRAMMGEHSADPWTAKILWSDFRIENDNLKITRATGTGSNLSSGVSNYFEVEVKGGVSGNAVVALYLGDTDIIIWSWHLWITDYTPDYAYSKKLKPEPENGKYIYDVPGGAVHSYNTAAFKTGINAHRFIMDRNLGAMNTNYAGSGTGSVYYQFGRKDPFAGGTLYKPDGSSISISTIAWNSSSITQESSKIGKNVPYSIQNPLKFITGTTWTTGDIYCPADGGDFMWQDPKALPDADGKVKKSIFDPCPSGWMLPQNGTWAGLSTSNMLWSTEKSNGIGRYYYPAGTSITDIYAFYPASGYRQSSNGSFRTVGGYGYCWSSSPSSTSAFYLYFNGNYVNPSNTYSRAYGCPVRCVQEYY